MYDCYLHTPGRDLSDEREGRVVRVGQVNVLQLNHHLVLCNYYYYHHCYHYNYYYYYNYNYYYYYYCYNFHGLYDYLSYNVIPAVPVEAEHNKVQR